MNEAENQDKPVEEEALIVDFNDIEETDTVEDTTEPVQEEVSTPAETEVKEVDFTPLLEKLSKNIKYMDQEVKIESIEDVIKNYQKGLDYDRKTEKLQEVENSEEMSYIKEKAKEQGMTPSEYIKALKNYEVQQAKQQEETEVQEMINNGVAETIARKVVETNRIANEIKAEKLKLQEQQKQIDEKARKDAENEKFINEFPDVDIKAIPSEVFKKGEEVGLITAYTQYLNQNLKQEIEQLKQNKTNKETSPVNGTTEHGGVVVEKQDDFLKGLGIE